MLSFIRLHDTGTRAVLCQYQDGWRINLDIREPNHTPLTVTGYLVPTIQKAKLLADSEILKLGHICSVACKGWVES